MQELGGRRAARSQNFRIAARSGTIAGSWTRCSRPTAQRERRTDDSARAPGGRAPQRRTPRGRSRAQPLVPVLGDGLGDRRLDRRALPVPARAERVLAGRGAGRDRDHPRAGGRVAGARLAPHRRRRVRQPAGPRAPRLLSCRWPSRSRSTGGSTGRRTRRRAATRCGLVAERIDSACAAVSLRAPPPLRAAARGAARARRARRRCTTATTKIADGAPADLELEVPEPVALRRGRTRRREGSPGAIAIRFRRASAAAPGAHRTRRSPCFPGRSPDVTWSPRRGRRWPSSPGPTAP